jgi:hypothetical protein
MENTQLKVIIDGDDWVAHAFSFFGCKRVFLILEQQFFRTDFFLIPREEKTTSSSACSLRCGNEWISIP